MLFADVNHCATRSAYPVLPCAKMGNPLRFDWFLVCRMAPKITVSHVEAF
jgi:hypothetical protein